MIVDPDPGVREARLKAGYESLYPRMKPEVWYVAASVADWLRETRHEAGYAFGRAERVVPQEHFDFRGKGSARPANLHTRLTDPAGKPVARLA